MRIVPKPLERPCVRLGIKVGCLRCRQPLLRVGRGLHRVRLGGPGLLAWKRGLRDRTFLDWKHGLPGLPLQDEQVSHFRRLDQGVDPSVVVPDRDQNGRTGEIVVPEVVVDRLEMPFQFPGRRIQREDAVGVEVLSDPVAAVMIV